VVPNVASTSAPSVGLSEPKPQDPRYQSKRWAFTGFAEVEGDDPPDPIYVEDLFSYMICGLEKTEDGRLHWQGYVECKKRCTLATFKKLGGEWAKYHMEFAISDSDKNIKYCSKQNGRKIEFGEPMVQGQRTDLRRLGQAVLAGICSVKSVRAENPHAAHIYGRVLQQLEDDRISTLRRTEDVEVYWLWGSSGTGKTHKAWELAGEEAYNVRFDEKYWDYYEGQLTIILDDVDEHVPYKYLLRILDNYLIEVPRKGRGPHPLLATKIFVTCDSHPRTLYNWSKLFPDASPEIIENKIKQITRRCKKIIHFSRPFDKLSITNEESQGIEE